MDATYQVLRHFTLPIAAITTTAGGRRNGFIVNSAQRASLVPSHPRLSLYISKTNVSHDIVLASGLFGVHLLRTDQWDVIRALGLRSARDVPDKLADVDTRTGTTGCPMLSDVIAGFECRVANIMDAGGATFVLGDVVDVHVGDPGDVMTSMYFRSHAPSDILALYEERLKRAQHALNALADDIQPSAIWSGPQTGP